MAKKATKKQDDESGDAPETAEAVSETGKALADAKAKLDEAQADHDAAQAAHAEATKGPDPEVGVHFAFEGGGHAELPKEHNGVYPFRLLHDGHNFEQVGALDSGVRVYRRQ